MSERGDIERRRWPILGLLAAVYFMLFLDDTVVNVALPSIAADLGFSQEDLTWVINGYVLMFGGFLLLGGRLADLIGRRNTFLIGLAIFGVASLANTLAQSPEALVASRACQGVGSALTAPAAFSLVTLLFDEHEERAKVFAVWSAIAGAGATAGVIVGGVITDSIDWRWIFYINVPVAFGAFLGISRLLPVDQGTRGRHFDVAGATVATVGIVLLVFTILETVDHGWLSLRSLVGFLVAAALIGVFIAIERRSKNPLVRLSFFVDRRRNTAVGMQYLIAAVLFGAFFLITLYMQQWLRYSPLEGGLAWLTFFGGLFVGYGSAPPLMLRFGVRPVLTGGLLIAAAGLIWFTQLPLGGSYWPDLVPGMVVLGWGLGMGYVAVTVAAVADAGESERGLATALLISGQQIGGALGIAVLVALATERTGDLVADAVGPGEAFVSGAHLAFWVGAALCVVGALVTLALIGVYRPTAMPAPAAPVASEPDAPVRAGAPVQPTPPPVQADAPVQAIDAERP